MHVVLFMCVLFLCVCVVFFGGAGGAEYRNDTPEINENSYLQIGWKQGTEIGMAQNL